MASAERWRTPLQACSMPTNDRNIISSRRQFQLCMMNSLLLKQEVPEKANAQLSFQI